MAEVLLVIYVGPKGVEGVNSTALGEYEQKRVQTLFDRIRIDICELDRRIAAKCQVQQPAPDADYILPIFSDGQPF